MRIITYCLLVVLVVFSFQNVAAQESIEEKIELLNSQKVKITAQEKEALKNEVEEINKRLDKNQITATEAKTLKMDVANKRAKNIENRHSIIDSKIALLERNDGDVLRVTDEFSFTEDSDGFSITVNDEKWKLFDKRELRFDRRTYSDFVFAFGLNNALIDGESIEDSPYKLGGSRFFELGWAWRTRVFKNSNFLRLHYGVSFQFNGLKPKNNQYFVLNDQETELQEFEFDLRKSKFRMDNLVFPVHFEFGPSKFDKSENKIRYSLTNKFRLGLGGYAGFNIGTRQKLKYTRDGETVKDKLKRGYHTNNFVYGLSAYIGFDSVLLYAKYALNPIFKNAEIEQHNISLGLRFDLQ